MTPRSRPALIARHPARLIVPGVLLTGTLALLSPLAHTAPLSLVDALLLATSAVCTTGLSSVNVAEILTPAGQLWLTLLIEVGALALLVLAFGFVGLGKQGWWAAPRPGPNWALVGGRTSAPCCAGS